ncbi:hypothetical protein Trydic_g13459 [Trypoxylus dichotomus]
MAIICDTYGNESWIITKANERGIQTSEMRFLRRAPGYTRMDRKRNTDVREELGVRSVNEIMWEYRPNWRRHVKRLEDCRISEKVLNYDARGKGSVKYPRKR